MGTDRAQRLVLLSYLDLRMQYNAELKVLLE